jgi:hypothetical protein
MRCGSTVAPAEFYDKTIPHVALLVRSRSPARFHPRKDFFVTAALERPGLDVSVSYAEETTTTPVEHVALEVAEVRDVDGGKFFVRMQADLVEHAAEINQPTDLAVTTPQSGNVGHAAILSAGASIATRGWLEPRTISSPPEETGSSAKSATVRKVACCDRLR